MSNLSGAVAKTMSFVMSGLDDPIEDRKKRLKSLKANIGRVANIPLSEIKTNENIRKSIDTKSESFLRLVESVKKYGVLENVVAELRINKSGSDYQLVCIAGHRRILAALETGSITKIPCLLQPHKNNGDTVGAALAENLNREDLHCLDVADGYCRLIEAGWKDSEVASHFCRDIRTVKHYLKMGGWSDEVKNLLRSDSEIFSTRVIMRQFAYKKFVSNADLKRGIKSYLVGKAAKSTSKKSAKKTAATNDTSSKSTTRTALSSYLKKQKFLSTLVKDEIKKAFIELKLI